MKKSNRKIWGMVAVAISLCCVCVLLVFGIFLDGSITPTPAPPQVLNTSLPIEIIIAQTSSAAQTQTMLAAPLTSTPFILDTPTMLPPVTLAPTWTMIPTQTPFVLATQQSTLPAGGEVCSCSGDTLNCGDFSTHAEAQACFDYCMSQGAGDIHKLDENNDRDACESLR